MMQVIHEKNHLKEMNALGQLTQSYAGNGYTTFKSYHPLTYRLHTVVTSRPDKPVLQDMEYNWTSFGNLQSRKKWLSRPGGISLTESFGYDNLNRLDWIMLNGVETGKHTYDEKGLGNITYKKADGTVLFGEAVYGGNDAGPHALTSATTSPGIFPPAQQDIVYNAFDKVASITEGDKSLQITYGQHLQRIGQQYTAAGSTTTKVYVGACEYITKRGETTTHTYLSGPEGLFAVVVKEPKGLYNIQYIHTDHLGSWNTISDAAGNRLQEINFDAWGNRRDPNTWRAFASAPPEPLFDRGFTGHEHLYGFQLINMNGRMYDPVVSRMLSPDNFVQAPDFSQSFNRYSYCVNNPLRYTDPSGEVFGVDDALVILAFAYFGGLQTNFLYSSGKGKNPFNPGNWNWKSPWTYVGIASGGLTGYTMGIEHCEYLYDINSGEEVLFSHLGDGKLNFTHHGTWIDNHTAFKTYFTTIQDVPLGGVDNIRKIANNAFVLNNTIGDASYFIAKEIDNSRKATYHYLFGDGSSVRIGSKTTTQLINSPEFASVHNEIIKGNSKSTNNYSVDMTKKVFHIGRTSVNYKVNNGYVTYEIYANDGFWDPDLLDERYFNSLYGHNPNFVPDGPGPNLERFGGKVYHYLPTYISLPFRSFN